MFAFAAIIENVHSYHEEMRKEKKKLFWYKYK